MAWYHDILVLKEETISCLKAVRRGCALRKEDPRFFDIRVQHQLSLHFHCNESGCDVYLMDGSKGTFVMFLTVEQINIILAAIETKM